MEAKILVKEICLTALSVQDGEKVQQKISELLKKNYHKIILDFDGIELFATPFF